jgi:hypothetical protein
MLEAFPMAPEVISRSEAKARGLARYYTGYGCVHGHVALRKTVNGVCVECEKDIMQRHRDKHREKFREKWRRTSAKWRILNPEKTRQKNKKWEAANPDKVQEKKRRWRAANPERDKAQAKRYREKHPEKIRIKLRRYRIENAERLAPDNRRRARQYQKDNPEAVRKYVNTRRARQRNAEGSHTVKELEALIASQDFECIGCGADLWHPRNRTLDHIIALSRGGSQWIENIQYLCKPCNSRKHDNTQLQWLCNTAAWIVTTIQQETPT